MRSLGQRYCSCILGNMSPGPQRHFRCLNSSNSELIICLESGYAFSLQWLVCFLFFSSKTPSEGSFFFQWYIIICVSFATFILQTLHFFQAIGDALCLEVCQSDGQWISLFIWLGRSAVTRLLLMPRWGTPALPGTCQSFEHNGTKVQLYELTLRMSANINHHGWSNG